MVKKEEFIKVYKKHKGGIPKIAKELEMKNNTAHKARERHFGYVTKTPKVVIKPKKSPVKIVNKTESTADKIRVKVDTAMYPEALTNFIKDMQKDGKTIILTIQ